MPAFLNNLLQGAKQKAGSLLGAIKQGLVSTFQKINNNPKKSMGVCALALTALDCYLDRPSIPQAIGTFVVVSAPMATMYAGYKSIKFMAIKAAGLVGAHAPAGGVPHP